MANDFVDPNVKFLLELADSLPFEQAWYRFEPKEDITAYEVAIVLHRSNYGCNQACFDGLPPEVQRHMVKVEQ